MGKDKRGVLRGKCLKCEECDEYETTVTASILCEYFGHRPVEHESITSEEETLPAKKPRLEPIQEELEIDLSCELEGQTESIVNKPGSVSTSASLNLGDVFPAETTSTRPSKPSATKNHTPSSPHHDTPGHDITEEHVELVEVVDVDTELESQQLKANELAKKEPAKKPRLEPIQEELEIDLSCELEGQTESIVNKPGSVSTSASLNLGDVFPAETTSTRPSKPSATKNHTPSSPHHDTPGHDITEEHVELVEVVDVDTELESQQLKANELAKKEPGVAFNIKRRQGTLFAECNVCSSEVAVGQANQDLSLLKLHIITSRHKLNVAISRSRSSEIPTEIQGLRNQIEGKFFTFRERRFCAIPAIHHLLFLNDPFSSI